ncbi:MAG: site-specific integrase [Rikenellaceae bacterium]
MSKELKVSFYLRHKELRKDGTVPIMGRITIGKSMAQFSAKCYVVEKIWDTKAARAIGKSRIAKELNATLDRINLAIHSLHDELLSRKVDVVATEVKTLFQGIASEQESLMSYCDKLHEQLKPRIGINLTIYTYKRYGIAFNHIKRFLKVRYNLTDISLQAIDFSFITNFEHYLQIDLGLKTSTMEGIIVKLKCAVRKAVNEGLISRNPFAGYQFQSEPIKPRSITKDELQRVLTTPLNNEILYWVRDMYIFSAFTGIAYGDMKALTFDKLAKAEDGTWWIHAKRRKTGVAFDVPLLEPALQIIDKYRGRYTENKMFKMPSDSKIGKYLRTIAEICGVETKMNFHTARHCYASVVTLSQGVPIETVSQMLGHSDMRATRIYAHISTEKINSDMAELEIRLAGKYKLA